MSKVIDIKRVKKDLFKCPVCKINGHNTTVIPNVERTVVGQMMSMKFCGGLCPVDGLLFAPQVATVEKVDMCVDCFGTKEAPSSLGAGMVMCPLCSGTGQFVAPVGQNGQG